MCGLTCCGRAYAWPGNWGAAEVGGGGQTPTSRGAPTQTPPGSLSMPSHYQATEIKALATFSLSIRSLQKSTQNNINDTTSELPCINKFKRLQKRVSEYLENYHYHFIINE